MTPGQDVRRTETTNDSKGVGTHTLTQHWLQPHPILRLLVGLRPPSYPQLDWSPGRLLNTLDTQVPHPSRSPTQRRTCTEKQMKVSRRGGMEMTPDRPCTEQRKQNTIIGGDGCIP